MPVRAFDGRPSQSWPPSSEEPSLSRDLRVNQMIRIPAVRVVDEEGRQLGVMPTFEALRLAQDRGYDLVEVAPNAVPPVTRLLDYGQYKYEAAKKEKEARRHQRSVDFKEIRIKPKIGTGDFETKVRRAIQFLEDGDRVKIACQFRGRELTHAHIGRDLLLRFAEMIRDHGTVERQPLLEGKSMSIVVASTHKPKPAAGELRTGEGALEESGPAPAAPVPAAAAATVRTVVAATGSDEAGRVAPAPAPVEPGAPAVESAAPEAAASALAPAPVAAGGNDSEPPATAGTPAEQGTAPRPATRTTRSASKSSTVSTVRPGE